MIYLYENWKPGDHLRLSHWEPGYYIEILSKSNNLLEYRHHPNSQLENLVTLDNFKHWILIPPATFSPESLVI